MTEVLTDAVKVDTDKVPGDVREQDLPVGGALDGALPRIAVPVVPTGIGLTREIPTLKATTYGGTQATTAAPFRIGAEPMRRRLVITAAPDAVTTAYLVVASDLSSLPNGIPIPQSQTLELRTAAELWVAAVGADLVWGFLAELDQG